MSIYKTQAFLIKKDDFRETSLIARFFSQDYGKISCLFKGIRGEPKKFASNLEPFSLNEIIFYKNNRGELNLASQCDCIENYSKIREDINKVYICSFMLDLIDSLMQQEEVSIPLFTLLNDCLRLMSQGQDHHKLLFIFTIKILSLSGFKPHFDSCVSCTSHIDYTKKTYFSSSRGGLLCEKCLEKDRASRLIYRGTIASITYIQNNEIDNNLRLGLNTLIKKELSTLLNKFLKYHLEKELKSSSYISMS
ncbi:MAG: DNA repair protein RecO [Candidatus Omnitrophica bacterium]|nr:DNA repair protein RecO [Candidatus Omnitrophota bacterium]